MFAKAAQTNHTNDEFHGFYMSQENIVTGEQSEVNLRPSFYALNFPRSIFSALDTRNKVLKFVCNCFSVNRDNFALYFRPIFTVPCRVFTLHFKSMVGKCTSVITPLQICQRSVVDSGSNHNTVRSKFFVRLPQFRHFWGFGSEISGQKIGFFKITFPARDLRARFMAQFWKIVFWPKISLQKPQK